MEISVQKLIAEAMPVLRAVAANMVKDGIAEKFVNFSEADQVEATLAYYEDQVKKNERMQTLYMTNPEFKDLFTRMVLATFKTTKGGKV